MSEPENIRSFEYRPSRINAGFNVDFVAGEETFHGLCRDISETGLRAAFEDALTVSGSGTLILRHPTGTLELEATVGYVDKTQAGFEFVFKTTRDREIATEYIADIARIAKGTPVVRFS